MGRSQEKLEKMQLRQSYRNVWQSDLMSTVTADTPCDYLIYIVASRVSVVTPCSSGPCVSYLLRKRALYNDMSRYTCCGRYMPCSGRCGESKCPQLCLATEVSLNAILNFMLVKYDLRNWQSEFAISIPSTRFMLQDEFNIHTTQCDNCIIGFMFCLNQIACIFSLVACIVGSDELSEASQLLSCLADMVYCTVCACMQCHQQMSRIDQRTSPYAGYPPATGYPQPYYPQPGHGYPPTPGYPPPGHGYPPAQGYPPPGHGYPPAPEYPSK
ncbi:hypothetical protein DY000_02061069 [Brassica cretica]|uniref:PLAC8 family protein n=1 Tax=Brassica cretica TaxID=69181 RepID=A0ABQ7ANX9_BRACR|nr:hypothetical protein DY000_02061069 [Brassica cretica]